MTLHKLQTERDLREATSFGVQLNVDMWEVANNLLRARAAQQCEIDLHRLPIYRLIRLSVGRKVTELFDMRTRPELILLQKTMVVVEGVGRTLDPELDMWSTADPVVREWIERHLGPLGKLGDLGSGTLEAARAVGGLPALIGRAGAIAAQLEEASEEGFRLSPASIEAIGRAEARRARWGNAALWLIAILMLVLVWRWYR